MTPHPLLATPGSTTLRPHSRTNGGGGRIRTFEGVSRQIYSLLPLAAWVPLPGKTSRVFSFRPPGVSTALARILLWIFDTGLDPLLPDPSRPPEDGVGGTHLYSERGRYQGPAGAPLAKDRNL